MQNLMVLVKCFPDAYSETILAHLVSFKIA